MSRPKTIVHVDVGRRLNRSDESPTLVDAELEVCVPPGVKVKGELSEKIRTVEYCDQLGYDDALQYA